MSLVPRLKAMTVQVLQHVVQTDRRVRQGRSPWARRLLGGAFVAGGLLWFLPVLGIWMLPLGLALLSDDVGWMRRLRRRGHARLLAWVNDRRPRRSGRASRRPTRSVRREPAD